MGGGGSSGSSTTQQAQATAPWQAQQPYQLQGLAQAAQNLQNQQTQGGYTGEFVAGGNDNTTNATNYGGQWAQNQGANIANQTAGTAGTLQGGAAGYLSGGQAAANELNNGGLYGTINDYATGAKTTGGPNGALSEALNNSAVSGANALQGFQGTLQSAANQGLSNPTQRIANDAGTYANSPAVQQQIAATNRSIENTLNTQTLPQLNQQQAAQGNLNSSRSGAAEGMARQAAAQTEGLADAGIYGNAYNTGMNTASGLYQGGLNTATSAGALGYNAASNNANTQAGQQIGLNEFNTGTQLGAANTGLGIGLQGNSQVGNATGLGINAGQVAGNEAQGNFNLGAGAGLLQQQEQQAADTNAYDQWSQQHNLPSQDLSQYWNIVGPNLGSSINSNTSQNYAQNQSQSTAGNIIGGIAGLGGLAQQFGPDLANWFGGYNNNTAINGDTNQLAYLPGQEGYVDNTSGFDLFGGG